MRKNSKESIELIAVFFMHMVIFLKRRTFQIAVHRNMGQSKAALSVVLTKAAFG